MVGFPFIGYTLAYEIKQHLQFTFIRSAGCMDFGNFTTNYKTYAQDNEQHNSKLNISIILQLPFDTPFLERVNHQIVPVTKQPLPKQIPPTSKNYEPKQQ